MSIQINSRDDKIRILGEIVGATNLEGTGASGSLCSPYCNVKWGERFIHQTKTISQNNNPIWTCDTGSLFIFDAPHFSSLPSLNEGYNNLRIEIYDKDIIRKRSTRIGIVHVPVMKIKCNQERTEFHVEREGIINDKKKNDNNKETEKGSKSVSNLGTFHMEKILYSFSRSSNSSARNNGSQHHVIEPDFGRNFLLDNNGTPALLAMRFRIATEDDIAFLRSLQVIADQRRKNSTCVRSSKQKILLEGERLKRVKFPSEQRPPALPNLLKSVSFKFYGLLFDKNGTERLKVKPGPDPDRPREETEFFTKAEILSQNNLPSTNWVEAGSGNLGLIYLEILSCEGLKRKSLQGTHKSNPFVCAIYEDCLVQTDVIWDCLSPMWMPWTQRAFVFHQMHPLSSLYLGVFHYNLGLFKHKGHGRVTVDLTTFEVNTIYTLKYNIFSSAHISNRKPKGSVTIRLQIESNKQRKIALAAITIPPVLHVNVRKQRSLSVVRYTCYGKYSEDIYNLKLLRAYIDEILELIEVTVFVLRDSIDSLLFWRGQVYFVGNLYVPLYSALLFFSAVYVVENLHLLPSFFFFSISLCMIVTMVNRRTHPSPWFRCKSLLCFIFSFLTLGRSTFVSPIRIDSGEGAVEARTLEEAWEKRKENEREKKSEISKLRHELQQVLAAISDTSIHTNERRGDSINPLTKLFPIQLFLRDMLYYIRLVKAVINWDLHYISSWFTCLFIVVGCCLLFIPWQLIIHRIIRCLVWLLFGPWMKIIDIAYQRRDSDELRSMMERIRERERQVWKQTRLDKEESEKLKAVRTFRFGKYSCKVPAINLVRNHDYPLPDSIAVPVDGLPTMKKLEVIPGQKHYGVMIPRLTQESEDHRKSRNESLLLVSNGRQYEQFNTQCSIRPKKKDIKHKVEKKISKLDQLKNGDSFHSRNGNIYSDVATSKQSERCVDTETYKDQVQCTEEGFEICIASDY